MNVPLSIEQKKAIAQILADIIYEEMLKDAKAKYEKLVVIKIT
ncbi:hypothetical protein [Sporosalibacterium faouarense]|nr:hypothetical protein [Sporosalibacterium faouarense]